MLDSCVYKPLLMAVFSCLQIVPPTNKMKGAINEVCNWKKYEKASILLKIDAYDMIFLSIKG